MSRRNDLTLPMRHPGAAWQSQPIRFSLIQTRCLGETPFGFTRHFAVENVFINFWDHQVGWFTVDVESGQAWTVDEGTMPNG